MIYNILKINTILIIGLFLLGGCSNLIKQKRHFIVSSATHEIGIKYRLGGYTPINGFDCSGLVYYVYKQNGYKIPRTVKKLYNYGSRVFFFRKPGDLLFFNTKKRWWNIFSWFQANHVGIYIGDNKMVHAPKSGGRVHIVNNVFNKQYWVRFYQETRRIIN